MMNLTISALIASSLTRSPMLMPTISFSKPSLHLLSIQAQNYLSNFLYSQSRNIEASISKSSFTNFIQSALAFANNNYLLDNTLCTETVENQEITGHQTIEQSSCSLNSISIVNCKFDSCQDSGSGGAIFYKTDGALVVHGCTFNKCTADNGAAIYASNPSSQCTPVFHSHYCCYSYCSASDKESGVGSAVRAFAEDLQLNYSSTLHCPDTSIRSISHGAQMDLTSNKFIASSHVNSTFGISQYCAGLEYRETPNGYFRFQNLVHHKGAYVTTFNKLQHSVDISNCNIVDVEIVNPGNAEASVLYVISNPVTITDFIIFDVTFSSQNTKLIDIQGSSTAITNIFRNSYIDVDISNCDRLETSNVIVVSKDTKDGITTRPIIQLNLGECVGDYNKKIPQLGVIDQGHDEYVEGDEEFEDFEESKDNVDNKDGDGKDSNKKKNKAGMIAGVTVACVAVAGAATAGGVIYYLKKKTPVAGAAEAHDNNEENQP